MGTVSDPASTELTRPEVFKAFYAQALPRVYSYLFHRCDTASAAEDLTQETFLAALMEIKKGKAVTDPIGWILGIARHKLLDQVRQRQREQRRLALVWQAEQLDDRDTRFAWEGEGSRERALAALRSVPDVQRAALALRYLDGLAVLEVARALGRSLHATESLLARGRENFKRAYAESERD